MKLQQLQEASYHKHPIIGFIKNHIENKTDGKHVFKTAEEAKLAADSLSDYIGEPTNTLEVGSERFIAHTEWNKPKRWNILISHDSRWADYGRTLRIYMRPKKHSVMSATSAWTPE